MSQAHNLVLIGLMGAGKTSVGRHLAQHLGWEFLDTDHVLEQRCGADIPWIFDIEGEAGFRRRETEVLEDLCQYENTVIATGGGIVLSERNRSLLKTCGTVVYLSATPEQLYARVAHDTHRPLLQVENPLAVLAKLLKEREPLYLEVADLVMPSESNRSAKYMADRLAEQLGNRSS